MMAFFTSTLSGLIQGKEWQRFRENFSKLRIGVPSRVVAKCFIQLFSVRFKVAIFFELFVGT
jgi:hypothetical protein